MFNVGDKVKVRSNLKVGSCNGVVPEMLVYIGLEATITRVPYVGLTKYAIDIDGGKWLWDLDMLIPVNNAYREEESVRLAKAVCEYEEIVHNLEQDLHKMTHEKDKYKAMYLEMRDMYNELINEYSGLVDDYNHVLMEYVFTD